jgi:hypothetical protein
MKHGNRYSYHLRIHLSTEWSVSQGRFTPHSATIVKIDNKTDGPVSTYNVFLRRKDVYIVNDQPSNDFGFDVTERYFESIVYMLKKVFNINPTKLVFFDSIHDHVASIIREEEFRIEKVYLLTYSTLLGYKKLKEIKK